MHRSRAAFTLIELSVVIAIIGMIVGGVIAGAAMIRGGEAKSVIAESQRYKTAVESFRGQYRAWPGDLINATQYWGAASCPNGAGTGTQTCNGNGNRIIDLWDEMYRSWQHLGNAGLVAGNYSGRYTLQSGRGLGVPGTNIPAGKMRNSGWSLLNLGINNCCFEFNYSDNPAGGFNFLLFGKAVATDYAADTILRAEDAAEIDQKVDDGLPGRGMVMAGNSGGNCATTSVAATAVYNVNSDHLCRMGWMLTQ